MTNRLNPAIGWLAALVIWVIAVRLLVGAAANPILNLVAIYGSLLGLALLLLRGDIRRIWRPAPSGLYGNPRYGWRWSGLGRLALVALAFWALRIGYGYAMGDLQIGYPTGVNWPLYLAVEIALVGLCEELFFREAALKALGDSAMQLWVVSLSCFFIAHLHLGPIAALSALGAGMVYLGARLGGAPILAVAVLHGLSNVVFLSIVQFTIPDPFLYLAVFLPGCAIIAFFAARKT